MVWQVAALLAINPLIFYWHHRMFHTKYLWKFHEIHHSAEQFNLITNFRNHPIDITIRTCFYTIPNAVLGIHPYFILSYSAIAGVITCFQHSDIHWSPPFIERWLIIGSEGHRVHHGKESRFSDKNFGILVLWDYLFRTLERPPDDNIKLGVYDKANLHNTGLPHIEFWKSTHAAARELAKHLRRAVHPSKKPKTSLKPKTDSTAAKTAPN
jgi:sterol desaturase/sphingolipid hydroxylase (fatty acid hydroxylase superfamily)